MQTAGYQLPSLVGDNAGTAQVWLHEYEKYMTSPVGTPPAREKAHKARNLSKFLLAEALEWWEDLTPAQQDSWDQVVALFHVRWPKPKATKPTHEEWIRRFRAKKLRRDELDQRVNIAGGGPDDFRWRIKEWSEELFTLGQKTGSGSRDLILYTYEQVPRSIETLMRDWREKNQQADFEEFCMHLGDLSQAEIKAKQDDEDIVAAHKLALSEHSEQLAHTKRELDMLRAQVSRMSSSPAPMQASPRGRGYYGRGATLPPYASREPSPHAALDPLASPFVPRRTPTPPTPLPPSTPTTPAAMSTPVRRRANCLRCGQPFGGTHQSLLRCNNPLMPEDEQQRRMSDYRARLNTPGTPGTPGTPSPNPRSRDVYFLDTQYDDRAQPMQPPPAVNEQFVDGDEVDDLALLLNEEQDTGKGLEAGY